MDLESSFYARVLIFKQDSTLGSLDLDVGFLTLSLEFGLGISVLNLECTVRTWSLDSGLGALSPNLESGVRSWSLEHALGNPESGLRVWTLFGLRVQTPDSGVPTVVHICSLEFRLDSLESGIEVQTWSQDFGVLE